MASGGYEDILGSAIVLCYSRERSPRRTGGIGNLRSYLNAVFNDLGDVVGSEDVGNSSEEGNLRKVDARANTCVKGRLSKGSSMLVRADTYRRPKPKTTSRGLRSG